MHLRSLAAAVGVALLVTSCAATQQAPVPPDRSAVESRISVAPPAIVAPAQPDWIELRSADGVTYLSSEVHPDGLYRGEGQILNPVDEKPAWWAESGVPGTESRQTVVVVGHNYSQRDAPFKVLSVAQRGDVIALRTPNGVLEYTVESVGPLPKGSLLADNELRAQVPGRLILANCDVVNGEPTEDNYFVVAQL